MAPANFWNFWIMMLSDLFRVDWNFACYLYLQKLIGMMLSDLFRVDWNSARPTIVPWWSSGNDALWFIQSGLKLSIWDIGWYVAPNDALWFIQSGLKLSRATTWETLNAHMMLSDLFRVDWNRLVFDRGGAGSDHDVLWFTQSGLKSTRSPRRQVSLIYSEWIETQWKSRSV